MSRAKDKADEVPTASVNMVFVLPMEFKAPSDEDVEQAMSKLSLDPIPATFEKLEETQTSKAITSQGVCQRQANDQDACRWRCYGISHAICNVQEAWIRGGGSSPNQYDAD